MKIVFIAALANESSSGFQRLWALKQCGIEVYVIDKHLYKPVFGKFAGYAAILSKEPRLLRNAKDLEMDIISLCKTTRPDIIWFEWATEISPSTIKTLKNIKPRPMLISFQDDNPWGNRNNKWLWKHYFKIAADFDLHLVKRNSDIVNLKTLGSKRLILWEHGIYSPLYYPSVETKKKYLISFVGTCFDQRCTFMKSLLESGVPIHIFGQWWKKRCKNLVNKFPDNFHEAIWGEEYANIIRESYLSLVMVSDSNIDEWTMRSYEIPGCATAPLVKLTKAHEEMFKAGETAFFYSNVKDCLDILTNKSLNKTNLLQIGKNAEQDFKTRKWMIEDRMKNFLTEQL